MKEEASLELSAVGPFVFLKGRRDKGGAEAEMCGMSPRRIVRRTRQTRRVPTDTTSATSEGSRYNSRSEQCGADSCLSVDVGSDAVGRHTFVQGSGCLQQ